MLILEDIVVPFLGGVRGGYPSLRDISCRQTRVVSPLLLKLYSTKIILSNSCKIKEIEKMIDNLTYIQQKKKEKKHYKKKKCYNMLLK